MQNVLTTRGLRLLDALPTAYFTGYRTTPGANLLIIFKAIADDPYRDSNILGVVET